MISNTLDGTFATAFGPLHWLRLQAFPLPTLDPPDFLSPEETEYWTALKRDKRRHDWLLGRRAASRGHRTGEPRTHDGTANRGRRFPCAAARFDRQGARALSRAHPFDRGDDTPSVAESLTDGIENTS